MLAHGGSTEELDVRGRDRRWMVLAHTLRSIAKPKWSSVRRRGHRSVARGAGDIEVPATEETDGVGGFGSWRPTT
jgi:hypothetical protein